MSTWGLVQMGKQSTPASLLLPRVMNKIVIGVAVLASLCARVLLLVAPERRVA